MFSFTINVPIWFCELTLGLQAVNFILSLIHIILDRKLKKVERETQKAVDKLLEVLKK